MMTNADVLPPRSETVEHKVETLPTPEPSSVEVGIDVIPRGTLVAGGPWKITLDVVVELRREGADVVAIYHEVDEYGTGKTHEEAMTDLLLSLVDYRESLEKREKRLPTEEQTNLARLRRLLER